MKLYVVLVVLLIAGKFGGDLSPHQSTPDDITPTSVPEPLLTPFTAGVSATAIKGMPSRAQTPTSSTALAWSSPTPYPVPSINLANYFPPPEVGPTLTITAGGIRDEQSTRPRMAAPGNSAGARSRALSESQNTNDLSPLIKAASEELDARGGGAIRIAISGNVGRQPLIKHHIIFDHVEIQCTEHDLNGCMIINDGVLVEGLASTVHQSKYSEPGCGSRCPAAIIFHSYADYRSKAHEGTAHRIAIQGFVFEGRGQRVSDGGVRATVTISNCEHCAIQNNEYRYVSSLGNQVGGSVLAGNFARYVLLRNNHFIGSAAAGEAVVNAEDVIIIGDSNEKPGRQGFSGGVSLVDVEPNTETDHAARIQMFNLRCDYTWSELPAAGNCINVQNPYHSSQVRDNLVGNVWVNGGSPLDNAAPHPLSNGLLVSYPFNLRVFNLFVLRAAQSCVLIDGGGFGSLFQDIVCNSSGGGGNFSVQLIRVTGATFRRMLLFDEPGTTQSTDPRVQQCIGSSNFESNVRVVTERCP